MEGLLNCVLYPAILMAAGLLLLLFTLKKINWAYGYRTKRFARSQKTWDYANKRCSTLMMMFGAALLVLSFPVCILARNIWVYPGKAIVILAALSLLLIIIIKEYELSAKFDGKGEPIVKR
jgi:uncharacterized membrane protein